MNTARQTQSDGFACLWANDGRLLAARRFACLGSLGRHWVWGSWLLRESCCCDASASRCHGSCYKVSGMSTLPHAAAHVATLNSRECRLRSHCRKGADDQIHSFPFGVTASAPTLRLRLAKTDRASHVHPTSTPPEARLPSADDPVSGHLLQTEHNTASAGLDAHCTSRSWSSGNPKFVEK